MSVDRLSNMLSSLKNASMTGNTFVELGHSKECEGVAKVLKDAGYLSDVKVFKHKDKPFKGLRLELTKDDDGTIRITEVKRISKPGRRLYTASKELSNMKSPHGIYVISTSRGILSSQEARNRKLGGELVCRVF